MVEGIGRAIDDLIALMVFVCVVFVPLGLWKMIDILIWIFHHIHISYAK